MCQHENFNMTVRPLQIWFAKKLDQTPWLKAVEANNYTVGNAEYKEYMLNNEELQKAAKHLLPKEVLENLDGKKFLKLKTDFMGACWTIIKSELGDKTFLIAIIVTISSCRWLRS